MAPRMIRKFLDQRILFRVNSALKSLEILLVKVTKAVKESQIIGGAQVCDCERGKIRCDMGHERARQPRAVLVAKHVIVRDPR